MPDVMMALKTDFFTPPLYYTLPTSHKGKFFLQKKDGSPLREKIVSRLVRNFVPEKSRKSIMLR